MLNNEYVIPLKNNIPELSRLRDQDDVITGKTEGVPPSFDKEEGDYVDFGTGAGGWPLLMAKKFPKARIVGIDIFQHAIDYANAEAVMCHRTNVEFYKGDIFKREQLPQLKQDSSYDLVNARLLAGVIDGKEEAWVSFASECYRLCRPDGWVQLTEPDLASMPHAEAAHQMVQAQMRILHNLGKCFSKYEMAIAPQLESFSGLLALWMLKDIPIPLIFPLAPTCMIRW